MRIGGCGGGDLEDGEEEGCSSHWFWVNVLQPPRLSGDSSSPSNISPHLLQTLTIRHGDALTHAQPTVLLRKFPVSKFSLFNICNLFSDMRQVPS